MASEKGLSGYELSRNWFDWCYENPELISPSHTALYFFIIEHYNRLGWKEKFGLPTQMAMDAIGVRNWRTYKKSFDDLVSWGFINVIEMSKNQYSATVIALVKNTKANTKALTKATQKHLQKQSRSIAVIDKPNNYKTNNQEPNNFCGEKKSPPKKKSELIFWKKFVNEWNEWYQTKFNGSYVYLAKDFAHLKKIYQFLEKRASDKKFEFTEENLLAAFKFYLNKAWEKDQWLRNNFSLANILSQFNQIANGTEKSGSNHEKKSSGAKVDGEQLNQAFNDFYSQQKQN